MKGMMSSNARTSDRVLLTWSDQTRRACFADVEAIKRVETSSFPGFSARNHSAPLRPVLAIVRL